jgi:hypothetical protein
MDAQPCGPIGNIDLLQALLIVIRSLVLEQVVVLLNDELFTDNLFSRVRDVEVVASWIKQVIGLILPNATPLSCS